MLGLTNISMIYGSKLLFDEVDLTLNRGKRYAVIGANGCGKSTLLRLFTKEEEPSLGTISLPKHATIGWLKQDQYLYEQELILNVVLRGKPKLWDAMEEKQQLLTNANLTEKQGCRLAELEEVIAHHDGYTAESFAHRLLTGLGIKQEYHLETLSSLSGGFKIRVLLAQAIFSNPDVLLLDEPTNHLDIMTTYWLENYLKNEFSGLLIFITHDMTFINNVSTNILDIDYGEIREYFGNYTKFEQEKKLVVEQQLEQKKNLTKKIDTMQRFVDRFKAKASKAKQASSKAKMIEKIELPDMKNSSRIAPNFSFKQIRNSGKRVLTVTDICKTYSERRVLNAINFEVNRGDKIAIIGHNGIGKSTLLKILLNKISTDTGSYTWGHEVKVSYFAQDHHEQLSGNENVLNWLEHQASHFTTNEVRSALGQMLFSKDEVNKTINNLSGGEAARLLFADIMLERGNVLVLDEPTNHLDLETISALGESLAHYPGTILLVSHNRDFVAHVATRVIALSEDGLCDFHGSYEGYIDYYGADYLNSSWLKKSG